MNTITENANIKKIAHVCKEYKVKRIENTIIIITMGTDSNTN